MKKLLTDSLNICKTHTTTEWCNGWMCKNKGRNFELLYHFLIEGDEEDFNYSDSSDLKIEIKFLQENNRTKQYRIDIKGRYNQHNFWYFGGDKFKYISKYVLGIIKKQYVYLVGLEQQLHLSNDAWF